CPSFDETPAGTFADIAEVTGTDGTVDAPEAVDVAVPVDIAAAVDVPVTDTSTVLDRRAVR
ncbi:MAG: hypothetical protein ACI9WU_004405, partial [Myxococcota bacterium]